MNYFRDGILHFHEGSRLTGKNQLCGSPDLTDKVTPKLQDVIVVVVRTW